MWGPRRRKGTGRTRAAAGGNPSFNAEEHHTHPSPGNASFSPGYTPSRTNFFSLSALDARHQVFPFPGSFAGWASDRGGSPGATSGRHQDQPVARWHVPRRPARPACLVTEPVLEPQKPTSTAPSVMYVKFSCRAFASPASVRGTHDEWAISRRAAHPHRLRPRGYFNEVLQSGPKKANLSQTLSQERGRAREATSSRVLSASGLGRTTPIAL